MDDYEVHPRLAVRAQEYLGRRSARLYEQRRLMIDSLDRALINLYLMIQSREHECMHELLSVFICEYEDLRAKIEALDIRSDSTTQDLVYMVCRAGVLGDLLTKLMRGLSGSAADIATAPDRRWPKREVL